MTGSTPPPPPPPTWALAHPRHTWAACALLALYYLATMSRDMGFYDSPELALVAVQGGVGHPIGQPLHTLLGHALVGLGGLLGVAPLLCLNALSALACALTLVPVVYVLDHAAPRPRVDGVLTWARPWLIALVAVHGAVWEPATRIEVYPLGTVLGALSVAFLTAAFAAPERTAPRQWYMAAAGLALALTTGANALTACFFALAMAPATLRALVQRTLPWRALLPAIAAALVGMFVWAYVPLAARDPDVVAWGRPVDWPSLRAYLSGADFSGKSVGLGSAEFLAHLSAFAEWSLRTGVLPLVALGLVGFGLRARALLPLVGILFAANVCWYARYDPFSPGVLDYLGYLGAPLWFLAGGAALLVEWSASRGRVVLVAAASALLAVTLLASPSPFTRSRARDQVTRELSAGALAELPRDAVLIVEADHWAAPLMYLQEVERERPDVVVLPLGLASSSWLWELLYRRHPDLRPFQVRGPGGREARVRRFLSAQVGRAAFTNEARIAAQLGLPSCVVGLLSVMAPCGVDVQPDTMSPLLASARAALQDGSPGTAGLLAWEAENRARSLANEGRARDAFHALTCAVPDLPQLSSEALPERVPPFELPVLAPEPDAMGSDQRNLLLAAALAARAQQPAMAQRLRDHAAFAAR